MKKRLMFAILMLAMLALSAASAQAQAPNGDYNTQGHNPISKTEFRPGLARPVAPLTLRFGFNLAPVGGANLIPSGANTAGFSLMAAVPDLPVIGGGTLGRQTRWIGLTSSNSFIGDSTVFQSKVELAGIGTDAPASGLTVAQPIQSLGSGFRSLNVMVKTTAAAGPLFTVAHDATLVGEGTAGSPLGVAVPLILRGAVPGPSLGIINVRNTLGHGISATGGPLNDGVQAEGGSSDSSFGGSGVTANGGIGSGAGHAGGIGIVAFHGFGIDGAHDGGAGLFFGDVAVTGMLSKGGGSFMIDHPLDPENKYLSHSFVESPDMKNIYDGNVVTDANGDAVVELPDYFEALNKDFRYQLTVIGAFAQAIVAEKIKGNRFRIKTTAPNTEVSWQVTGIRRDPWANEHRVLVEQDKPEKERGYFLHPEAYRQPEERDIVWSRNPELMRRMKETRELMRRNKPDKER